MERVYLLQDKSYPGVAHLVDITRPGTVCSTQMPPWPDPLWRGLGSDEERRRAEGLRLCKRCDVRQDRERARQAGVAAASSGQAVVGWLAANLARARRNAGYSLDYLAITSGIPKMTIVRIERGGSTQVATLGRLATALSIPPWRLLQPPYR